MNIVRDFIERLRALVFRRQLDRDLDDELAFHLERETAERARMGSADPERDARIALGGVTQVREATREARGVSAVDAVAADTRFALRSLRRSPGFTATVIGVLGLAIGAATAVYAVVDRVLLAGLPYEEPDRLVRVFQQYSNGPGTISVVDFQAIESQQRSFEAIGALRGAGMTVTGIGAPELLSAGRVTSGFFAALRVRPIAGRLLEPRDDAVGAPPVVVLSYAYAERAFGRAGAAVGRSITLDGVNHEIVGVLGADRRDLAGMRAALWPAMQLAVPQRRGPFGYRGIARLRDGVSIEAASRELAGISARTFPLWRSSFADSSARLAPFSLQESIIGGARSQIGLFAGAVALILLLAVANVATLLLVRASGREQEFATRAALGAGRLRLARLVMTECLVLTALAVAAGMAFAAYVLRSAAFVAPNVPRIGEAALNGTSIVVGLALAIICGLLVSIAPITSVLRSARSGASLAGTGSRAGSGRRAARLRSALVVSEFALALPLLVGAGLLATSFLKLQRVDPGFDPAGLYAINVSLPPRYATDSTRLVFWRRLVARTVALPEIAAAGLLGSMPPDNFDDVNNFELLDQPIAPGGTQPTSPWPTVSAELFDAMGMQVLEGRAFGPSDADTLAPTVIVSRSWAAKYYPSGNVIGRQMRSGGCTTCPPETIVGVVSDIPYRGLEGLADAVYVPSERDAARSFFLMARSRADAATTFRALRGVVASLDPDLALTEITMTEQLATEFADPKRWTVVVGAFAAAGLVLASLGIFGLMSYTVRQRRRELGVRLALGAPPTSLTALVVRTGLRHALVGVTLGVMISLFMTRWLEALLFGVGASDPLTLVAAALVIMLVAALACWLPGLRAASIRPLEAIMS